MCSTLFIRYVAVLCHFWWIMKLFHHSVYSHDASFSLSNKSIILIFWHYLNRPNKLTCASKFYHMEHMKLLIIFLLFSFSFIWNVNITYDIIINIQEYYGTSLSIITHFVLYTIFQYHNYIDNEIIIVYSPFPFVSFHIISCQNIKWLFWCWFQCYSE